MLSAASFAAWFCGESDVSSAFHRAIPNAGVVYIDDEELATNLAAHAFSHREDGDIVQGPLSYKKWVSQVERATVAYQSRNGA